LGFFCGGLTAAPVGECPVFGAGGRQTLGAQQLPAVMESRVCCQGTHFRYEAASVYTAAFAVFVDWRQLL